MTAPTGIAKTERGRRMGRTDTGVPKSAARGQHWQACWGVVFWGLACWSLAAGSGACAPTAASDSDQLPPSVQDPAGIKTASGALGFYQTVVDGAAVMVNAMAGTTGMLIDELAVQPLPVGLSGSFTALDSRQQLDVDYLPGELYNQLHQLRAQAREARGFVSTYLPDSSTALRGHLYALEGYADLFLADAFCSGMPLSTVNFGGDYTLASGSSTAQVYTTAVGLFDSALALLGDSARLQPLAAVGRGRALLALDRYADAAAAVAAVPTEFRYDVVLSAQSVLIGFLGQLPFAVGVPGMGDREGLNGLDYRSSNDPRTPVVVPAGQDPRGNSMYFPAKYPQSGPTTFVLADGIEARLIEAEAALAAGGDWLAVLNTLRTDGTYDTQPNATDPSQTDTLWHAGAGGVAGLKPLVDPGTHDARVDLLFRERAFWLYLTGHRQGDLRRLIRQYLRAPDTVYPWGSYPGGLGQYGSDVTLPVPTTEAEYNPHYTGCIHRNA